MGGTSRYGYNYLGNSNKSSHEKNNAAVFFFSELKSYLNILTARMPPSEFRCAYSSVIMVTTASEPGEDPTFFLSCSLSVLLLTYLYFFLMFDLLL